MGTPLCASRGAWEGRALGAPACLQRQVSDRREHHGHLQHLLLLAVEVRAVQARLGRKSAHRQPSVRSQSHAMLDPERIDSSDTFVVTHLPCTIQTALLTNSCSYTIGNVVLKYGTPMLCRGKTRSTPPKLHPAARCIQRPGAPGRGRSGGAHRRSVSGNDWPSWLPAKASSWSNSGNRPAAAGASASAGSASAARRPRTSDSCRQVTRPSAHSLLRRPARPAAAAHAHEHLTCAAKPLRPSAHSLLRRPAPPCRGRSRA